MFSVIVPTYNYARFIGDCLDSVLAQTHTDWECLVIDNASTDNTEDVVKRYGQQDSRIIYTKLNENKGPSHARNIALREAKGDYILFLDADDLIAPRKLANTFDAFAQHKADLVFSDYVFFNESPQKITNAYHFSDHFVPGMIPENAVKNKLVPGNVFAISCIISKKEVLQKANYFDEAISYNEDWDLWLRIALGGAAFCYDNREDGITLIRNHQSSHSKDQFGMYYAGLYVCKKNYPLLDPSQKKIFDKKLLGHRYKLKRILTDQYFNDKSRFERSLCAMQQNPYFEGELAFCRKKNRAFPAFLVPVYFLILKTNYYIAQKCL